MVGTSGVICLVMGLRRAVRYLVSMASIDGLNDFLDECSSEK